MSSLLSSGGSRAYGFDLDIVKSSSSSARSSHTSSPSSTLSESSNSSRTISIKKARTPRKRPNQNYNEAAALLSTIYPNIFSTKSIRKPSKQTKPFDSLPDASSELLPPLPVLSDAAFLIPETSSPEQPSFRIEPKLKTSLEKDCTSPASNELREAIAISPSPSQEDFDAESILDEEVQEGIDSIMGNLTMNTATANNDGKEACGINDSLIDPYLGRLMGFALGDKFELGLGFQFRRNMPRALRHFDEGDWWRSPTVPMQEIVPKFKTLTPSSEKKKRKKTKTKKKKKKEEEVEAEEVGGTPATAAAVAGKPGNFNRSGLGLKLNHEEVLKAWSGRGSVFADGPRSPHPSAEALMKLADVDLFAEGGYGGGVREVCMLRYKDKRRTRLFSKKIRYQVRKTNADQRPRLKGRFVRGSSLLPQAIGEESLADS